MTSDEMRKREEDEHVRYVKEHLCDRSGDKEFVFISYKSDDWRVVLRDIVYTLLTKYGLNVYFDGSFAPDQCHYQLRKPKACHP